MPEFTKANIEEGKKAFLTIGCAKCHGEDGRGMMASNVGTDAWGNETKAADLTSGMLRGGTEPLDIYRHIDAGINGTPMPSFRDTLKSQPQTTWNLVSYVLHVADSRRLGAMPDSGILEDGLLKPLPGVKPGAPSPPPGAAPAPGKVAWSPTGGRTTPRVAAR
jgi:cytochrome c oxidase cbb3-type subunit 2